MSDTLQLLLGVIFQPTLNTDSLGQFKPSINFQPTLLNGVADGQVDLVYLREHTILGSGSPLDLDLAGGSLLTPSLAPITFVEVTTIIVLNRSTTAGQIISVGGGSNTFSSWLGASGNTVKAGKNGLVLVHSPDDSFAVTSGTGDILRVSVNTGSNVPITVALAGRSS